MRLRRVVSIFINIMKIERPKSKQHMPEDAVKVFTGKIFNIYQWKQEMYDGSFVTFEKLKSADTVIVFPILENGNILLTKQMQPGKAEFIGGCGGRLDNGEDPEAGARREMLEETGYESKELILWKAVQPISKIDRAVYVFVARDCKKIKEQNLDGGEKVGLFEVNFDEFLQYVRNPLFSEHEIVQDVYEALLYENKHDKLMDLFYGSLGGSMK